MGGAGPRDRDDDIALLAARFDGIPSYDVVYWFLDPKPQTAGSPAAPCAAGIWTRCWSRPN